MSKKIGQGIRQTFRKNEIKVNVTMDGTGVVNIKYVSGKTEEDFNTLLTEKFADINSEVQVAARLAGAPAPKPAREKKEKVAKEKKEKKEKKGKKEPALANRVDLAAELEEMEDDGLNDLTSRALAGKAQNFPIGFVGKTYKEAAAKKNRDEKIEIILDTYSAPETAEA